MGAFPIVNRIFIVTGTPIGMNGTLLDIYRILIGA
jgi:hypothetical protein